MVESFDFADGDVTQLAPGAVVLVVANEDAFEARYGTAATVAGEFTGSLSDSDALRRLRLWVFWVGSVPTRIRERSQIVYSRHTPSIFCFWRVNRDEASFLTFPLR